MKRQKPPESATHKGNLGRPASNLTNPANPVQGGTSAKNPLRDFLSRIVIPAPNPQQPAISRQPVKKQPVKRNTAYHLSKPFRFPPLPIDEIPIKRDNPAKFRKTDNAPTIHPINPIIIHDSDSSSDELPAYGQIDHNFTDSQPMSEGDDETNLDMHSSSHEYIYQSLSQHVSNSELSSSERKEETEEEEKEIPTLRRLNSVSRVLNFADPCTAVAIVGKTLLVGYNSLHDNSHRNNDRISIVAKFNDDILSLSDPNSKNKRAKSREIFKSLLKNHIEKNAVEYFGKASTGKDNSIPKELVQEIIEQYIDEIYDTVQSKKQDAREIIDDLFKSIPELEKYMKNSAYKSHIDKLKTLFHTFVVDYKKSISWLSDQIKNNQIENIESINFDGKDVHAELRVIGKIFEKYNYDIKEIIKNGPYDIGVSKLCCPGCSTVVKEINEKFKSYDADELINTYGEHGVFSAINNWTPPSFIEQPFIDLEGNEIQLFDQKTIDQNIEKLRKNSNDLSKSMYPDDSESSASSDFSEDSEEEIHRDIDASTSSDDENSSSFRSGIKK